MSIIITPLLPDDPEARWQVFLTQARHAQTADLEAAAARSRAKGHRCKSCLDCAYWQILDARNIKANRRVTREAKRSTFDRWAGGNAYGAFNSDDD